MDEIIFWQIRPPHRISVSVDLLGAPEITTWSADGILNILNAWSGSPQGTRISEFRLPLKHDELIVPGTKIVVTRL